MTTWTVPAAPLVEKSAGEVAVAVEVAPAEIVDAEQAADAALQPGDIVAVPQKRRRLRPHVGGLAALARQPGIVGEEVDLVVDQLR